MPPRTATVDRRTGETDIRLRLNLDGDGGSELKTGLPFLDHMLAQVAAHGLLEMDLRAEGDLEVDAHHTVEDTAIALGQGFRQALGDCRGICRFGQALMPMDEALTLVAVDFSGRSHLVWKVKLPRREVGGIETELFREWFAAFARSAQATVHVWNLYGDNSHHIVESCYKGFARALVAAVAIDNRRTTPPSTKGIL